MSGPYNIHLAKLFSSSTAGIHMSYHSASRCMVRVCCTCYRTSRTKTKGTRGHLGPPVDTLPPPLYKVEALGPCMLPFIFYKICGVKPVVWLIRAMTYPVQSCSLCSYSTVRIVCHIYDGRSIYHSDWCNVLYCEHSMAKRSQAKCT